MKIKLNITLSLFLMLFAIGASFAQEQQISGTVTDENGVPLPGVNIVIQGSSQGTNTDFDGNYSLNVNEGQTLVFSFVGFEEHTELVGTMATINVQLSESSNQLEQVVVTAFGRVQTRNETTASVSSVSSADIEKVPEADAREALVGKLPGVVMQTTAGTPGAEPEIRIRGQNSITANNEPLYVVDGVPINSGNFGGSGQDADISTSTMGIFSLLNSGDIENISILKDASAVAPYGADAANGVILVTTKTGRKLKPGDTQFSINSFVGVQNWATPGPTSINADDRYTALMESIWNTYGNELGNGSLTSRDQAESFYTENFGNAITDWRDIGKSGNYNWKEILRRKNAFIGNVYFSMAQKGESSNFYGSLGYNKTEGTFKGTELQRITGFLNYSSDFWDDRFHFKVSANVGNASQDGVAEEAGMLATFDNPMYMGLAISSWVPPFLEDGSFNLDELRAQTGKNNVLFTQGAKNGIINTNITRALQNTMLDIDINDNLTFRTLLGLDYSLVYFKNYGDIFHGSDASHGSVDEISQRLFNYTTQNSLDFKFDIAEDHHFNITALQEYTKYKSKALRGQGENFPIGGLTNLSGTSAAWRAGSTFTDQWTMRYVGLLNYNFQYKYVLSASYSHQGDTRFSSKWGDFYSVGAAWNMHQEEFIRNIEAIDRLKLKIGYGITGNAGIDRNQYQSLFGFTSYRGNPATSIDTYGTDITWEKSRRFDVGFETGLFNERLYGSLSFYSNTTTDMLFEIPIPYSSSFSEGSVLQNSGEMSNEGFEIELGGVLINTPDFKWVLNGSFSTLKNKVTKIPEGAEITTTTAAVRKGHMVNEWYVPDWYGVDPQNGDPLWYVDKTASDQTTNKYSEAKKRFQGKNPLPTYYGYLGTHLEFKNIFLDATFTFSGGNQVYEFKKEYFRNTEGVDLAPHNSIQEVFDNAWYKPGDIADYPRWDYSNATVKSAVNESTHYLYDDDYIRLQDIALGYDFKKDLIKKLGLSSLTISVRGRNLWTWVKDDHMVWNVEARSNGYTALVTPSVKSVVFNLNLKF